LEQLEQTKGAAGCRGYECVDRMAPHLRKSHWPATGLVLEGNLHAAAGARAEDTERIGRHTVARHSDGARRFISKRFAGAQGRMGPGRSASTALDSGRRDSRIRDVLERKKLNASGHGLWVYRSGKSSFDRVKPTTS